MCQVWDVLHDVHLAQFNGHWGNVMTCQFSEMDEDVVITGASDSTVRMWRVSAQPAPVFGTWTAAMSGRLLPAVVYGVYIYVSISRCYYVCRGCVLYFPLIGLLFSNS